MRAKLAAPTLAILLACATILAGCSGSKDPGNQPPPSTSPTKGAIKGLLIDDVYRPIQGATMFLLPVGETATTSTTGEFQFGNLPAGTYTLKVESEGHEGNPRTVDVEVGQYSEVEFEARRVSSVGGRIDTLQYSVFLPCSVASPLILGTVNCVGDLSGDTYRSGISGLNLTKDVTVLVVEYKTNKADNYVLSCREDNGTPEGGEQYLSIVNPGVRYGKGILVVGESANGGAQWDNDKLLECVLFYGGQVQTGEEGFGVGADLATSAQIILSAFIGPPEVDVNEYHLMGED